MKFRVSEINAVREVVYEYEDILSKNANSNEHGTVQAWANGEGFTYFNRDDIVFNCTWAEWDALKKATRMLYGHGR